MRTQLTGLALAALLLTTACTGGGDEEADADPGALAERLSTAKTQIDDAQSLEMSLATKELPQGTTGLLSAEGQGNHDPAFEGEVTVVTGGTSLDADVVSVDGELYVKTGFSPSFMAFDPETLGAPDPAGLLDAEDGVSKILELTDDLGQGDRSRDGEDVLTTIEGSLPGDVVASILPTADEGGAFSVRYRLTEDDELRDATISGPFYEGAADVTYRLSLGTSDDPVEITAPEGVDD